MSIGKNSSYYHNRGGSDLIDNHCGLVMLYMASGEVFTLNLCDDPELTLSGYREPCEHSGVGDSNE